MPERKYFRQRVEEGIAVLALNHPPVNTLCLALLVEARELVAALKADGTVRGVVVTGEGTVFSAGADATDLRKLQNAAQALDLARKGQELLGEIAALRVPVIAAVNGACLGGGNELAMACHLRVASETARFGQPEINLGLLPGFGGTQRLPRLVGAAAALELMLTGESISAHEARALGLVNLVVPAGDLLKTAVGLAKKIAAKGKLAVGAILDAVQNGAALPLREGLALEADLFGKICATEDMREGVAAFLEKRAPRFRGR
ncbi:MAG: enoyl-CoA hydratase/isomerase family protein [Planctomycetes bacterium]|nr:enoyl-CoA hydratase/isomerase family protein [Planctomycetota bacterium]